ncbi:hypothetical protein EBU94_09180 [bacterium]|nr:hypothetical protein [bacterium]
MKGPTYRVDKKQNMYEDKKSGKWKNYSNFSRGYTYFPIYWSSDEIDYQGDSFSEQKHKSSKRKLLIDTIVEKVVARLQKK